MKKVLLFFLIVLGVVAALGLMTTFKDKVSLGDKVAVVRVTGIILDSTNVINELEEHSNNRSVKAVVLRVDSPGGGVAPSQEIYEEILKLKEIKKVVVSMGSVAASGGYYIAAPADVIFANAGTLTGSIGVIMEIPNVSDLMAKIGIETQVVKSGRHKDIASVFKSLTPEEKDILQTVLDDVHDQFIGAVSEARGMEYEAVKELSDGRVFTGRMAKELGLVDEIGNLQDAIMLAGEISGIKGKPDVLYKEEEFSFIDILRGNIPDRLVGNVFSGISLKYLLTP